MRDLREAIIDMATIAIGGVAFAVALITLQSRHQSGNMVIREQDRDVSEWREFAEAGQLRGPADAPVTIIVFGDYECPVCRSLHPVLEKVMDRWPKDVELVYRHFPLPYHRYAYAAARAAQCAADQGRFWGFHGRLFEEENWLGDSFLRFAEEVGVPNLERFEECVGQEEPVEEIETDIEAGKELSLPGIPTLIVNGRLLARRPSFEEIDQMIMAERRADRSTH